MKPETLREIYRHIRAIAAALKRELDELDTEENAPDDSKVIRMKTADRP